MNRETIALLSIGGLFVGMLVFSELGRRIGIARLARDPEGLSKGAAAAEAALFALLGLLIAFTFSGAASRFEDRRHLINSEVNAIGTAYLRLDLPLRGSPWQRKEHMLRYVDGRVATYRDVSDREATKVGLAEGAR